jgi:short-subunit dehydrogenase
MQLENQRIVLTGAASGIGLELLERLAARPAQVVAVDLNAEGLERALAGLAGSPAKLYACACDLGNPEQVEAVFAFALENMGGIDLFIANAGFPYYEKLNRADWGHIERIFQVNVFSPIYAALMMQRLNAGRTYRVVITASAMGLLGLPGYALYSSTKAALDRFAECYRYELEDPAALTLVYPIGTRTHFFQAAAEQAAPLTWPIQTVGQVANAILKGIEGDQANIYPSLLFRVFIIFDRYLPFLRRIEQWIELKRFESWMARQRTSRG